MSIIGCIILGLIAGFIANKIVNRMFFWVSAAQLPHAGRERSQSIQLRCRHDRCDRGPGRVSRAVPRLSFSAHLISVAVHAGCLGAPAAPGMGSTVGSSPRITPFTLPLCALPHGSRRSKVGVSVFVRLQLAARRAGHHHTRRAAILPGRRHQRARPSCRVSELRGAADLG